MSEPTVPQKAPIAIDVTAGTEYWWCSCGKSRTQPFCDGAHSGSEFTPIPYKATETKTIWFCACKHTSDQPVCDGSHSKL